MSGQMAGAGGVGAGGDPVMNYAASLATATSPGTNIAAAAHFYQQQVRIFSSFIKTRQFNLIFTKGKRYFYFEKYQTATKIMFCFFTITGSERTQICSGQCCPY